MADEGTSPPLASWSAVLDRMVERGLLDRSGRDRAEGAADETSEPVDRALTQLGLVSERDVAATAAEVFGLPLVSPDDFGEPVSAGRISAAFLRRRRLALVADDGETLTVAAADPTDQDALEALAQATGRRIALRIGLASDIAAVQERGRDADDTTDQRVSADDDVERLRDLASEAPVIRLANRIIQKAIDLRASDIHLEPVESGMRVRYRLDGALRDQPPPPSGTEAALVSRIKIIARLDIAERRLPQDGRIGITHRGQRIDLRVSTVPALLGEAVVLRILDRNAIALDLDALIPQAATLKRWSNLLERPNGILLMTGPTGSGKTTTLYASLRRLAQPDRKILTVEDPVEFALEGALQVQVKSDIGLTFANALRSFLRHDPDIVMVGEIRDRETADIAVQAALTGHLVLSTLHTNSAAAAIPRLLDMGVEGFLLASVVIGVGAQRLVRTLCPDCRERHNPPAEVVRQFGLERFAEKPSLWRATGCAACNHTGYRGRAAILEVMEVDDALRDRVLKNAHASDLQAAAVAAGMEPMIDAGLRLAVEGRTTLEDVMRATRAA